MDPTSMSPNSIMPSYPWLLEDQVDVSSTVGKIKAMKKLGVPYPEGYENIAASDMEKQANEIAASLKKDGIQTLPDKEIVALIAYLQRLGKDIKAEKTALK
jgi:cytochrome c oxidase cbb3-type subunit I/II